MTEHQIEIDLNRCLCVHSLLQLVDVSLQTILYSRGIIPEPFQNMGRNDSQKVQEFLVLYQKVAEVLKSAFRSFNRDVLEEVLVVFGNTPYAPLDIFRIDVQPCRLHEDMASLPEDRSHNKSTCSTSCGTLSPKERRRIFTTLTCGQKADAAQHNAPRLGKLVKVFISLKTRGKLMHVIDGLELDESYEPPESAQIQHMGTRTVRINTKKCPFENMAIVSDGDAQPAEIWHQLRYVISSL